MLELEELKSRMNGLKEQIEELGDFKMDIPKYVSKDGFVYMNPGSVSIPKEQSHHGYMIIEDGQFLWKDLDGNEKMKWRNKDGNKSDFI